MILIKIFIYKTSSGSAPFLNWCDGLSLEMLAIVRARVDRLRLGNFGDCKLLKNSGGVYELRIHSGPGFRVYFGKKGAAIVVLLTGGTKGTQTRDVLRAKRYWTDCEELW